MTNTFEYHGWELMNNIVVLKSESGETQLAPTTLLVALDDTGDPSTTDPVHPVFGIGGCAVLVGQYVNNIWRPWALMKQQYFDGPLKPLHAADLRNPTESQIAVLSHFFREMKFFRLAVLLTDQLAIKSSEDRVLLICRTVTRFLEEISHSVPYSKVAIFFEASDRLSSSVWSALKGLKITQNINGQSRDIPIEMYENDKQLCEPAFEVADFVIHTAGKAVRKSLKGTDFLQNPDFRDVFETEPDWFSKFAKIDRIELA